MSETKQARHRVLREVLRHYLEFQDLFRNGGQDSIDYDGFSISLWDLQGALKPQKDGGILSDRKREAIFYNVIMDKKQKDVAAIMGITTVSVGQYVEQGVLQLADAILGKEEPKLVAA